MRQIFLFTTLFLTAVAQLNAQIERIDPPFWYADMQYDTLELLVKGKNMGAVTHVSSRNAALQIIGIQKASNPNYVYLTLYVKNVKAGMLDLNFQWGKKNLRFNYEIKAKQVFDVNPVGNEDVLYLITPDRFANGNPKNDVAKGFAQTQVDRNEPYERHGGDIAGITSKLDYLKDLGITGLWISPVLENNQPKESYHGYAITDLYRIDPRMGTLQEYIHLKNEAEKRGIKLVKDMVFNHFGDGNYLFKEMPDSNWYHWHPEFTRTNYRATTMMDPYRSEHDYHLMMKGWFDTHMPDLDQTNPHVAKYLIQNTLWWIQTARLNGIRIDTYAYCDQDFMSRWQKTVKENYPDLYVVAEIWEHGVPPQLFFDKNLAQRKIANTHLDGITDFQVYFAILEALNQNPDWASGINKLYYTLSADYLYEDPAKLLTFLDNHDVARFYGSVGKDLDKYKVGTGLLLTLRGIPCIYYGTEILMAHTDGHGKIREDFPGGWPGDAVDKFTAKGRTAEEQEAFEYMQTLLQLRRDNPALHSGKMKHFVPADGVYVFSRTDGTRTYTMVVNTSDADKNWNYSNYGEVWNPNYDLIYSSIKDFTVENFEKDKKMISIPKYSFLIFATGN